MSLDFFVRKAGVWFSEHGPLKAREFWVITLARAFHMAPALRHLITAIALYETPIVGADPDVLLALSQRIYHNYSLALRELTQPDPHPIDVTLGPILAWTLDSISNDESRAAIHANAIEQLTPNQLHNKNSDLDLPEDVLVGLVLNIRRYRRLRLMWVPPGPGTPVFRALAVRNKGSPKSAQEVYAAFEKYYETFDPHAMTAEQIAVAAAWIKDMNIAIKANVYLSGDALTIFSALRLLCLISGKLLPRREPFCDTEADDLHLALEFVLEQNEDMLKRKLPKRDDQNFLHRIISLTLQILQLHTPAVWRWQKRVVLARMRSLLRKAPTVKVQHDHCGSPQTQTNVCVAETDEDDESTARDEQRELRPS